MSNGIRLGRETGDWMSKASDDGARLSDVTQGSRARLTGMDAGHGLRARLAAMGLVPGVEVLMVKNEGGGPAVVEVKGSRLALGRGMARKIRVK